MTLGSGPRYDIGGRFTPSTWRPGGFSPPQWPFIIPGAWAYRDVDLRLSNRLLLRVRLKGRICQLSVGLLDIRLSSRFFVLQERHT